MSLESAYFAVQELVETFKANESKYLSQSYQEAEVRKDSPRCWFAYLRQVLSPTTNGWIPALRPE
jgi:hypothetical protein